MNAHNVRNWTKDLRHSILPTLPLHYQRAFHGDIIGWCKVYIHLNLHWRCTVPSGWCQTSWRIPQRPPLRQWRHWSWHGQLEFTGCSCWLSKRLTFKSSSWLQNTPCQWSPGWDWLSPGQLCCPEWLWVSQAWLWLPCSSSPVSWTMIYLAAVANLN